MLLSLLVVLALLLAGAPALLRRDPPPVLGVYRRPGRWYHVKYAVVWLMLQWRKKMKGRSPGVGRMSSHEQVGYGQTQHDSIEQMDVAQPLSEHPLAFDAVFFNGASKEGHYLVIATERRKQGVISAMGYLVTPGRGLLCSRKIPDTVLFGAKDGQFGAEGFLVTPVEPMKKWRVTYDGQMWSKTEPTKNVHVKIDVEFSSDWGYFNCDTDMHPSVICRALSAEPWSREYFNNLKQAHQTHYEQMGFLNGTADIDGEIHQLRMQGFRDHSFGHHRDWGLLHRYVLHVMFLQDGLRVAIVIVCQPCTFSRLESGYVYTPGGDILPMEWCDFQLYQHGENGTPPADYAFQFKAGPRVYTAQLKQQHQSVQYYGWEWQALIHERFMMCEVDGVQGRCVAEFMYGNASGRPEHVASGDPLWFRDIVRQASTPSLNHPQPSAKRN